MTPTPGTRLGPYEVGSKLGDGGMGVVYRGTDTRLAREVAIKVLPPATAAAPDALARSSVKRGRLPRSITRTSARCSMSAATTGIPTS